MQKSDILSDKQKLFISMLKKYLIIKTTCKKLGICRMTYYRWLKLPVFKEALESMISDVQASLFSRNYDT